MSTTSAVKYKIDNLIGIHTRDGYETVAMLTPDELAEIRDRIVVVEAENARLRSELQDVLEYAVVERSPLRAQEIASIRAALAEAGRTKEG